MSKPTTAPHAPLPPKVSSPSDGRILDEENLENLANLDVVNDLSEILEEIEEAGFPSTKGMSKDQAAVIESTEREFKKQAKELRKLQKEINNNPELATKSQKKLKALIQSVFISGCASKASMAKLVQFAGKFNFLPKELNKFSKANGLNPLWAAVAGNRSKADLEALVSLGCDINARGPNGNTVGHFAANIGVNKDMMKSLISLGLDINAKNNLKMTMLDIAALKGDKSLSRFLLDNGAKLFLLALSKEGRARGRGEEEMKKDSASSASSDGKVEEVAAKQRQEEEARKAIENERKMIESFISAIEIRRNQLHLEAMQSSLSQGSAERIKAEQEALEKQAKIAQDKLLHPSGAALPEPLISHHPEEAAIKKGDDSKDSEDEEKLYLSDENYDLDIDLFAGLRNLVQFAQAVGESAIALGGNIVDAVTNLKATDLPPALDNNEAENSYSGPSSYEPEKDNESSVFDDLISGIEEIKNTISDAVHTVSDAAHKAGDVVKEAFTGSPEKTGSFTSGVESRAKAGGQDWKDYISHSSEGNSGPTR